MHPPMNWDEWWDKVARFAYWAALTISAFVGVGVMLTHDDSATVALGVVCLVLLALGTMAMGERSVRVRKDAESLRDELLRQNEQLHAEVRELRKRLKKAKRERPGLK